MKEVKKLDVDNYIRYSFNFRNVQLDRLGPDEQ